MQYRTDSGGDIIQRQRLTRIICYYVDRIPGRVNLSVIINNHIPTSFG